MVLATIVFWVAAILGVTVGIYQLVRIAFEPECDCIWCGK